jgi:hypothetical protein
VCHNLEQAARGKGERCFGNKLGGDCCDLWGVGGGQGLGPDSGWGRGFLTKWAFEAVEEAHGEMNVSVSPKVSHLATRFLLHTLSSTSVGRGNLQLHTSCSNLISAKVMSECVTTLTSYLECWHVCHSSVLWHVTPFTGFVTTRVGNFTQFACSLPTHALKGKAIPLQTRTGPEGSRRFKLPDFKTFGTRSW